jgi:hypothetical protein
MATGNAAPLPATEETTTPNAATISAATAEPAVINPATASPSAAPQEGPEAFRVGTFRPGGANVRGMTDRMSRCLATLGLRPGASLDEINTTYYTILKRFPENPTEDDETHLRGLRHAYDTLRRGYVPPKKKAVEILRDKRLAIPLMCVATAVLAGVLLHLNWGTVKLKMTRYEPGTVMRLSAASVPFGTIVGYEAAHKFPAGRPGAAYEVRLEGKTETIWVSERIIVNGMVRAGK